MKSRLSTALALTNPVIPFPALAHPMSRHFPFARVLMKPGLSTALPLTNPVIPFPALVLTITFHCNGAYASETLFFLPRARDTFVAYSTISYNILYKFETSVEIILYIPPLLYIEYESSPPHEPPLGIFFRRTP